MAEHSGASPLALARASTDVDDSNSNLTHGAAKTPQQASFGGEDTDTKQLSACCGQLPSRVPQPDHLTHPHAAAGDPVVAATGKMAAPTPPKAPTTPQPTLDAADAGKSNAAELAAQMVAAAAATASGGARRSELPTVTYDQKYVSCRIITPVSPTDLAAAPPSPDSPPTCRVELVAAAAHVME